jgi:hypothetical protein
MFFLIKLIFFLNLILLLSHFLFFDCRDSLDLGSELVLLFYPVDMAEQCGNHRVLNLIFDIKMRKLELLLHEFLLLILNLNLVESLPLLMGQYNISVLRH